VQSHRQGKEHQVDREVAYELLEKAQKGDNSVFLLTDTSAVPTNRFGEDEKTAWLFQNMADDYGHALKELCHLEKMPLRFNSTDYMQKQGNPYINQLWLGSLGYDSYVYGSWLLNYDYWARGVRRESAEGAARKIAPSVIVPYTPRELENAIRTAEGVLKGNTPASKLEKTVALLLKLRKK
jgi:hypothetical protein